MMQKLFLRFKRVLQYFVKYASLFSLEGEMRGTRNSLMSPVVNSLVHCSSLTKHLSMCYYSRCISEEAVGSLKEIIPSALISVPYTKITEKYIDLHELMTTLSKSSTCILYLIPTKVAQRVLTLN